MISEPEIVDLPAQTVAYIHVTVARAEIMQAMHAGLEELSAVLKAQNVAPTGPWFTHHVRRPNETFDFRICFPVNESVTHEGRVYSGEWRWLRWFVRFIAAIIRGCQRRGASLWPGLRTTPTRQGRTCGNGTWLVRRRRRGRKSGARN